MIFYSFDLNLLNYRNFQITCKCLTVKTCSYKNLNFKDFFLIKFINIAIYFFINNNSMRQKTLSLMKIF